MQFYFRMYWYCKMLTTKCEMQNMGKQSVRVKNKGAQNVWRKVWRRKVWGYKVRRRKVWGTKYGGAKYGGATWLNPTALFQLWLQDTVIIFSRKKSTVDFVSNRCLGFFLK